MELPMAIVIGVLFAGGTYLLLRPNLIRIVMGLGLYSNGANLLMIACGGFDTLRPAPFILDDPHETPAATGLLDDPSVGGAISGGGAISEGGVVSGGGGLMDPLPPDIILTAIVISFAVGALFLTICYRVYLDWDTDDPEVLARIEMNEIEQEAHEAFEGHHTHTTPTRRPDSFIQSDQAQRIR